MRVLGPVAKRRRTAGSDAGKPAAMMDRGADDFRLRGFFGGLDHRDGATGYRNDTTDWVPTETVVATIPLGGRVHDVIASRDGEHVYVAQSDSVTVINSRHRIVAKIPVDGYPKNLALDADGKQLFVIHYGGSVSVIDTLDYTVQTLCGGGALDVVISPDGHHLYAAHDSITGGGPHSEVSVIDIAGATTITTVPVVNDVAALALSTDGTYLYAISSDRRTYYQYPAGWLTIIDTKSRAVVDTIPVGACPEAIFVSPDGTWVYVTHYDTCSVSAVNLTTLAATAVVLGDAPLALEFTPDGTHAYVTTVGSLTVIDTATNNADDIVTGDLPRGVQISLDGKHAYITTFGDHTLSVVDTITNSVTAAVDVPGHPEAVAISPDGERVYVGDYWAGAVTVISTPTVRDLHTDVAS